MAACRTKVSTNPNGVLTLSTAAHASARVARSNRWLRLVKDYGQRLLLLALTAAIGLALMMNGAVAAPYRQIAFLTLSLALLPTLGTRLIQPVPRALLRLTMLGTGFYLLLAILQVTPLPFGLFAHPVWTTVGDLGIEVQRVISIAPFATLAAIPTLILPFLVFAAMLLLCQKRREALFAWKALATLGLCLTGLSILLEVVFPEATFFSRFEVGGGAFNGIFVNRNTTAAFLGLTSFVTAGWLMLPRGHSRSEWPRRTGLVTLGWQPIMLSIFLFLLIITLITTRSRAGVTFALICLTLTFAAIFALSHKSSKRSVHPLGLRAKVALALASGAGLFFVFGEPVISRMGLEAEDGRWCAWASSLQMILERPLFGSGFGTFAEAFPEYRDPECLGSEGTWTRAHNSYLELLAGMGLIGGLGAVALLGILIRTLTAGVRTRKTLVAIPLSSLGALVFVMMHSAFDFPLQVPGIALYFAALMGSGCAVSILTRQPRQRSKQLIAP